MATDEQGGTGGTTWSCLLELRARVEALEAAQHHHPEQPDAEPANCPACEGSPLVPNNPCRVCGLSSSAPPAPAGGLVERVAGQIAGLHDLLTVWRLARRNGELIFQAGSLWVHGHESGIEWNDVLVVNLDELEANR